ncbi:MAG TPA: cell division protein ZapD, partial [Gallionella sp.]|nr:cell division protein ZapD [Gallionella sp.]
MIDYEFPLNEKVRTLLRLEDLFARTAHFIEYAHGMDHHAALLTLFEILEVAC